MAAVISPFQIESAHYLRDVYWPRLRTALDSLPDGDLWWTPFEGATSAGNLLLHLEGNVQQWICSGLGGQADHRERSAEFLAAGGATAGELLVSLQATVLSACRVIEELDPESLAEARTIQGFETTVLGAIYHVVEHFSWHVGQIVWIAKLRAGREHGIAFYDDAKLEGRRNEP